MATNTVKHLPLINKRRRIPLELQHSVPSYVTFHDFPSRSSPLLLKFQLCLLNNCRVCSKMVRWKTLVNGRMRVRWHRCWVCPRGAARQEISSRARTAPLHWEQRRERRFASDKNTQLAFEISVPLLPSSLFLALYHPVHACLRFEVITKIKISTLYFSPENERSMFLRNAGIYLELHTAVTSRSRAPP